MLPMGASGPLQHDDGIVRTLGHKQGANHIEVVAVGGERVEPHRSFNPWYSRPRIAQERQIDAALYDEARIIGVEHQRAFEMVFALGKLSSHQRNTAHDAMAFGVVVIDAHGPFDHLDRLLHAFRGPRLEFVA